MSRDVAAERERIEAKVSGKTIPSVLAEAAERFPEIRALSWKEDGQWKNLTFPQMREAIADVSNGLLSEGLKRGEFVVILARNIHQHYVADYATVHAGGVPVSLYNTSSPEQIAYILNHCKAALAVVEDRELLEKLLKIRQEVPTLRRVILVTGADEFKDDEWIVGWDHIVAAGKQFGTANPSAFEESWKKVDPEDLLTLIYTSGTTGPPKAVMITHHNALFAGHSLDAVGARPPGDKMVSYLPLAHIAERLTTMYNGAALAGSIYCCPDVADLLPTLLEVKPQIFFGVPRVFEKMYGGIQAKLAAETDETRKQFATFALDIGRQVAQYRAKLVDVPEELQQQFDSIAPILAMVRAGLGMDEIRYVISGAAPIATEVLEFFHSIGLQVQEIYGQSEGSGPTSLNPPLANKLGTVGPAIPGVEVKLADDGEILVRGANVASGYYKEPDLTAETFDSDGWLHSGDIGEIDEDGYVRIVDRKKEIIITAGGKNIAPSNIEGALKQHPLIGQAAVIGDRRPFVSALIVLDNEVAPAWAKARGIAGSSTAELAVDVVVLAEIEAWVAKANERFANVEQVKRYTVLGAEWTAESEELTPTLKLKRRVINDKYSDEIEKMYSSLL
ncbi:MAG: long-chain fatty acid--CoA ligase [Actinomycetota bacterium]